MKLCDAGLNNYLFFFVRFFHPPPRQPSLSGLRAPGKGDLLGFKTQHSQPRNCSRALTRERLAETHASPRVRLNWLVESMWQGSWIEPNFSTSMPQDTTKVSAPPRNSASRIACFLSEEELGNLTHQDHSPSCAQEANISLTLSSSLSRQPSIEGHFFSLPGFKMPRPRSRATCLALDVVIIYGPSANFVYGKGYLHMHDQLRNQLK